MNDRKYFKKPSTEQQWKELLDQSCMHVVCTYLNEPRAVHSLTVWPLRCTFIFQTYVGYFGSSGLWNWDRRREVCRTCEHDLTGCEYGANGPAVSGWGEKLANWLTCFCDPMQILQKCSVGLRNPRPWGYELPIISENAWAHTHTQPHTIPTSINTHEVQLFYCVWY